jgi:ribonuclease Z
MTITFQVLGMPGRDNAVLVKVDSGHSLERLLFDCGDGCLTQLGFDQYFRANFDRPTKPNRSWGPPGTSAILQHRFQGYLWNLNDKMHGTWQVTDIHPTELRSFRYDAREGYANAHDAGREVYEHTIFEQPSFRVEALTLNHRTPSSGYIVREPSRQNIDGAKMDALGLSPGPWLKLLKEADSGEQEIDVSGSKRSLSELRELLLVESPGDSFAYLTDFLLSEAEVPGVAERLRGCRVIICDGQYRHADLDLALKNYHMTAVLSAQLARQAEVGELVLFHLSDRYQPVEWNEMLAEARQVFPNTRYPVEWQW